MSKPLRIALAQLNPTLGDLSGNLEKHIHAATFARDELKADIIVFPELSLIGYPPEDLLLRRDFIQQSDETIQQFTQSISGIHCLISHPYQAPEGLYNACSLIYNGNTLGRYAKQHLPNYGVFDEDRYFIPGNKPCVVSIHDTLVGLVICEDLWFPLPVQQAAALGASIILSPNASPFETHKHEQRMDILAERAQENQVTIVYVNAVGGQDELVFDGDSMVINQQGQVCAHAGYFNETTLSIDIDQHQQPIPQPSATTETPTLTLIYQALVTSLRDYVNKNHFPGVYIGLSGGIDSALTLAIAVDALGKDRVHAVIMPSRYTAPISLEDANALVERCGCSHQIISIEPTYDAFLTTLQPYFDNKASDITEENLQARCRAVILMALSNKHGYLVLPTGNRSELAVGYCTLYGDMCGGFSVLKDIPKTLVFALAKYRNSLNFIIPERTIERPPTAELAHNQKDEDSLPPYSILDEILERYLNRGESADSIIRAGFNAEIVEKVLQLVRQSEYKRRQSAIGPRINDKSFGKDWRYPLTNQFKPSRSH